MLEESRFNSGQREALAAEGNVLVSASAGSGKTTVMIEKILRLIAAGKDVTRMAVMTFSRAAASEMKNRLVKGLYEMTRSGVSDAHISKQLEAFPFANICTIDSFCYTLIKKYFAAVGADPSAKPMDPDDSALALEECVDRACEELLTADDSEFIAFAERYTVARRLDSVKSLMLSLRTFLKVQPDPAAFLSRTDGERAVEAYFLGEFKRRVKIIAGLCGAAAPALREAGMGEEGEKIAELTRALGSLSAADTCEEFFSVTGVLRPFRACVKRKEIYLGAKELFNETAEAYRNLLKDAASFAAAYYDRTGQETCRTDCACLARVTTRAEELYAARKKREGKLDFDDMGALALRILDDGTIRAEVRASFDYIFVDEYQDTNLLQESLLRAISDGGNVFAVGDVKQAIYHFRYAEPEIFHERMRRFSSLREGRNIALNENYRSRREILDFVNLCCAEIMTEDFCSIDYRRRDMMKPGTAYEDDAAAVEIYFLPEEEEKQPGLGLYSVKDAERSTEGGAESDFVASLIAGMAGKEKIYRPKTGVKEPVGYGDIAVLARKRSECARIARALAARNIPYSVADAEEGVYAPRELLVDFVRLCVSTPDVSVINAMLSPVFSFSPAELMEIRNQSPETSFWEAVKSYDGDEKLSLRAKRFVAYADGLRAMSASSTAVDIMTKALVDGLDGYFLSLGGDAGGRIYKFLASVSRMECSSDARDFLAFYEASYKGERPPSRKDSVTVMTMHKSKGLEFPVVILPSVHARSVGVSLSRNALFADRELGLALKSADSERGYAGDNFATKVQKLKKLNEEREELARLMYVAFTRARNRLVLTGKRSSCRDIYSASCIGDFVSYAADKNPVIGNYYREAVIASREEKEEARAENPTADLSCLKQEYRYAGATVKPNKTTVSELLEAEEGVYAPYAQRRGADAASDGTAYHLVMQKIDFRARTEEEVRACIGRLTEEGELDAAQAERLDAGKIARLLRSDIIELARNAICLREQPFMRCMTDENGDKTLVQGVIDLIIEEPDGLTVVDYKASAAPERALALRYGKQLELYAEAAGKIWGKPVKNRILFNILRNYIIKL